MTIGSEIGSAQRRRQVWHWRENLPSPLWLMPAFALVAGGWLLYPRASPWTGFPAALTDQDREPAPQTLAPKPEPQALVLKPEPQPLALKPEPAAAVAPPAPQPQPEPAAGEPPSSQSIAHARNAAVRTCLPALNELSQMVVDGNHVAFSTWNNGAANERLFQSVAGIKYDNKNAPLGISILLAAPVQAEKCDGATVQIQPSALPCDRIAKNLTDAKLPATDLNGIRMIEATRSTRVMLLPTRGNGCAVIGVGTHYAR